MPIPTGGLITRLDFSNPASYPGSGTAVYDLTANNNDFAFQNNNFTYSTVFGGEVFIDSSNILQTVSALSGFSYGTTAVSMNIWMQLNVEGGANLSMFAALNDTGGSGSHNVLFFGTQSGPTIFFNDNTDTRLQNTTFPLNEWKMITLTKPANGGSDSVKMYVDGVQVTFTTAGTSTPISLSSSNSFVNSVVANLGVWSCDMTVGEYAIWNVELSSGQVSTLYNETRYRFSKQLEYNFQNGSYPGSGTSIFDLSGNGITANIIAGGTYVSGFPNYIDLQGNTNILATNANIPTNTSLTINAWVSPVFQYPSSGYGNWWSTGNDGNGTIPFLGLSNVGGTNVIVSGGFGAGTTQSFNSANFDPSKWYYYSVVSSSATGTSLFVNGSLVGTNAGWIRPQVGNFRIGTYDDPTSATKGYGKLAYVDFYNVALTSAEILANYNASIAPYDSLVAEYDFQNPASYPGSGSTVYDLSGTGNTLAITSGGTFVSGAPSYINLNGNTAIYKSPVLGGVANTNVYTLNAWYWLPSSPGNSVVYEIGKDVSNQAAQVGTGFGLGTLYGSGGFGVGVLEFTGAVPNKWNFLSYVSTGTATTAYLNGVAVSTGNNVPSIPSDGGIVIGTALNSSSPPAPRLDLCSQGRIGYYSVYKSALSAAEISTLYNNSAPIYDNIVAKYDLNDPLSYSGTGNTLYDLSENNYDITLSNTTYTSTANYNSLIFLKGSSSKGTYVGDIGLGTTTPIFTYAMWVKPTDLVSGVNYGWFLSYGKELFANGGAPGLFGEYAGANNYSFSFGSGKGLINSGQSLTLNQWYFLTATCDGTDIKLYLNGSYLGTTTLSPGAINAPQELAINYLTQTSVGYISFELNYLEIYNKALSAGEITTIYNNTVSRFAPAPPAYQGIVGGRQFNQGFNG